MADELNTTTNWWDSSSRNRFDRSSSSSSTTTNNNNNSGFGWPRSAIDSGSSDNLHMMGLGFPSTSLYWNQPLLGGDKSEGSFRQENMNSTSSCRGFSLDQTKFSPSYGCSSESTVTCQGLPSSFQLDSSSDTNFQGVGILLESDNQNSYHYGAASNNSYGMNMNMNTSTDQVLLPSWSTAAAKNNNKNKVPRFLRTYIPKQQPQRTHHLHFSNNAPFWNSSAGSSMNDVPPSPNFSPSLQTPYTATQSFDGKPKHHLSGVRDTSSTAVKKMSGSEPASKKAKKDQTASPLPAFTVRKEKTGDKIAALQQLVSPFGKTNTASVLSEAIEYIKFLHEQVAVLSTPYMKIGAPTPHKQNLEKAKYSEGPKKDLRSRRLCLVPVSSTVPVTMRPQWIFGPLNLEEQSDR